VGVWWRAGGGVAVLQTGPMAVVLVYIQQCKSFVEMCIVSCLSASQRACVGGGMQPGAAFVIVRSASVSPWGPFWPPVPRP
jgi:hypothetical protein